MCQWRWGDSDSFKPTLYVNFIWRSQISSKNQVIVSRLPVATDGWWTTFLCFPKTSKDLGTFGFKQAQSSCLNLKTSNQNETTFFSFQVTLWIRLMLQREKKSLSFCFTDLKWWKNKSSFITPDLWAMIKQNTSKYHLHHHC